MYRKINYYKGSEHGVSRISVSCEGLRDFFIEGVARYDGTYELWGCCHKSTRYLYNAFISVFGTGYFDTSLNSDKEAYDMVDTFMSLVDTMNASFEEEEKLKQEKLKQYRKEYYQKQKAEKAKRNAIINSKQRKPRRSTPQQPSI